MGSIQAPSVTPAPSPVPTVGPPAMETIKLSEAMRAGAKLRPQCSGMPFLNGSSCALGAAFEGLFGRIEEDPDKVYRALHERYGIPDEEGSLIQQIFELNDQGHWPRQAIASWLESIGL